MTGIYWGFWDGKYLKKIAVDLFTIKITNYDDLIFVLIQHFPVKTAFYNKIWTM